MPLIIITFMESYTHFPLIHTTSHLILQFCLCQPFTQYSYDLAHNINTHHTEKKKTQEITKKKQKSQYRRKKEEEEEVKEVEGEAMGNAMGMSKKAKVMKIDGETFKMKIPATANDVVKDYPGHVLLDSESVKHFGLRAKPLEPHHELKPKKIYFLVELPKIVQPESEKKPPQRSPLPRRARSSGIRGMNAQERLDFLMLSKRSVSDLAFVKKPSSEGDIGGPGPNHGGPLRVKMRVPRAQLERLMEESGGDGADMAEKIMSLYAGSNAAAVDGCAAVAEGGVHGGEGVVNNHKPRGKRVSFRPVDQGEIHVEASSQSSLINSSPYSERGQLQLIQH